MRVTDGLRYQSIGRNLARIQSENAEAANQASSGLRVGKPSDDPVAAAELARLRAGLSSAEKQRSVAQSAKGDAELAESTLSQVTELLGRARELAMQGSNDSLSATDRAALGDEAKSIRTQVLGLANARGSKGYLFAGSHTDTPAFDSSGLFRGDDVQQTVDIGGSSPTTVGASGASAFTAAGGRDIFADLDALSTALLADDRAGTAAALDNLDQNQRQVTTERARVGLVMNKLDSSDSMLEQLSLDLGKRQSAVGAADPFEAYSKMTVLGQSLERAVAVSRQMLESTNYWRT